jgi:hypothetical protein
VEQVAQAQDGDETRWPLHWDRIHAYDDDTWARWRRRSPAQVLARLEELGLA